MDVSNMKEGDFAGLALLQKKYGFVGVMYENGRGGKSATEPGYSILESRM